MKAYVNIICGFHYFFLFNRWWWRRLPSFSWIWWDWEELSWWSGGCWAGEYHGWHDQVFAHFDNNLQTYFNPESPESVPSTSISTSTPDVEEDDYEQNEIWNIGLTPIYQQITRPDRLSTLREPLTGKIKARGVSSATPSVYRPRADQGSNPGRQRERLACYPLHHQAPTMNKVHVLP